MDNQVLRAIRNRRSVIRFEKAQVDEEKIRSILEAGRWAPSWLNKQPWSFVVITDTETKERISQHVPTIYSLGIREAPVCVAVCVDTKEDPYHFVEDGTAATQNMALAAHSLGLGSSWIGILNLKDEKDSAEEKIREVLKIPKTYRVISLLPVGTPKYVPEKSRKELEQLVYRNKMRTG